jgi:hypothetical protein
MSSSRLFLRLVLGAAIAGTLLVSLPSANAAVYLPRQSLPTQTIQQFLSNPSSLLTQFPNGGPQMIAMVRDLLASDPATLKAIIALLSSANPEQSTAMGTAGGQVALMAVSVDPGFATDLQDAFASSKNSSASVAFSAVVGGDIKLTAATGGVGGGGGGGPVGQNGSFGGFFASTPANFPTDHGNTPDNFTNSCCGGSTPGSPVSPSH